MMPVSDRTTPARALASVLLVVAASGAAAQAGTPTGAPAPVHAATTSSAPAPKPAPPAPPAPTVKAATTSVVAAPPAPSPHPAAAPSRANTVAHTPPLPDLTFASVNVANVNHVVGSTAQTIVVDHVFPPPASSNSPHQPSPCNRSFTFPLIIVVKNIGNASFVPKNSFQAVGVNVGSWGSAKDLITLNVNGTQTMSFSVTLPPGDYTLSALIDLHNGVAEANPANDKLEWPLKVTCELRSNAAVAPHPIPKP